MNILIVSTRQINVGDEFIWFGLRRLLKHIGIQGNFVLFNRHPSINPRPRLYTRRLWLNSILPTHDNSYYLDETVPIHYVIFAGTPKWSTGVHARMLHPFILRHRLRTSFLGVGTENGVPSLSSDLRQIFQNLTDLIVVRDPKSFTAVRSYPHAYLEPCPALFCADSPSPPHTNTIRRLGIVVQAAGTTNQSIPLPQELNHHLLQEYRKLSEVYDVALIAHYIKDVAVAERYGLGRPVYYSSFSEDFFDIYRQFDAIVSLRVHGCGIAASLGIPSIHLTHDDRAATTAGFLSHSIPAGSNLVKAVNNIELEPLQEALSKHRRQSFDRWIKILENHLLPSISPNGSQPAIFDPISLARSSVDSLR